MPIEPDPQEVEVLAAKWLAGTATPDEAARLHAWFDQAAGPGIGEEPGVLAVMVREPVTEAVFRDRLWQLIRQQIGTEEDVKGDAPDANIRQLMPGRRWSPGWRYAAAIVLLIGAAVLYERPWSPRNPATPAVVATATDVAAPQSSRAVIRLPNGRQIDLDSARSGQLLTVGGVSVVKEHNDQLAYNSNGGGATGPMVYHELFVPRGSRPVDLTLADGTHVWLDAESSLRYPVAFAGDDRHERRVELTGEAYFEVSDDPNHPFLVSVRGQTVRVLGTRFNVNAYADDGWVRTTLLSGRVLVLEDSTGADNKMAGKVLTPGEQALGAVNGFGPLGIRRGVDTSVVMAWKNGRFEFNGAGLPEIMAQLRRWYDVDVQYHGPPPVVNFRGGVSRSANVSSLLNILQATGALHYHIRGRTVVIQR